ncbi:MAG: restriction endonuclease subunit S [Candidatus Delongbacteria bacterium]|nr:restriction endonuclease subunit S [Candidatus Delongbacteria bacterium]
MKNNWQRKKLKDLVLYSKGRKPRNLGKKSFERTIPYIDIKAFEKGIIRKYSDENNTNLTDGNDILIVWDGARFGLSANKVKGAVGSTIMKLTPIDGVDPKYLSYFIKSKYRDIQNKPRGVGIPHVEPSLLWNFEMPTPNKDVQIEVAQKIDALFSKIDAGEENLKKVEKQLEVYRQAVLKKAFENTGYKEVKLNDIVKQVKISFDPKKTKDEKVYIGLEHISKGTGEILEYSSTSEVRSNKNVFNSGNILYGKLRPYLSKVAIPNRNGVCSTDILVFEAKFGINNELVKYLLLNRDFVSFATDSSTGVQHPRTKWNIIKEYHFFIPKKIEEQQKLVSKIKSKFLLISKLHKDINNMVFRVDSLRQSILKKAFEGKLV